MDDGVDEFASPEPPPGWTYEWKRKLTLGAEEPSHMVALTRMGWEPVPVARHPEMMPGGGNYVHIERKGMILMERPTELVEEALEIERRRATGQVRAKEAQLAGTPEGTMTRDDPRVAPKIKKAYEAGRFDGISLAAVCKAVVALLTEQKWPVPKSKNTISRWLRSSDI